MSAASEEGAEKTPAAREKPAKSRNRRTSRGGRSSKTKRESQEASIGELPLTESAPDAVSRAEPASEPAPTPTPTEPPSREDFARDERSEDRGESRQVESSGDATGRDQPSASTDGDDFRDAPNGQPEDQRGGGGGGGGHGGGHGGGGGGFRGEFGFRKKFKKDKHKNKFHQQGQGGQGGGGQGGGGGGGQGQRWKQPASLQDNSPLGVLPDPVKFLNLEELATRAAEIATGEGEPLFLDEIAKATHHELLAALRMREIPIIDNPGRLQLIQSLYKWATENRRIMIDRGHLDVLDEGHGFLVHVASNYRLLPDSTFVPASFIRKYGLKRGHRIEVQVQPAGEGERCPATLVLRSVMGEAPDEAGKVVPFEDLVPYYPTNRIFLEVGSTDAPTKVDVSMRCVDILTPIGFGQRGLIVAPPRTGKTILLQGLANSVATNHPEAKLIVLLVDERPEEVTDFRRRVNGEVISSTFDETPESHVHAAEMVSEVAKRLVEKGEHVVILLDSITRLARAYNALASNSGKIMSGGLEATALQRPKRFFGAARNIEGGGSLTVMGTALIDTNSRMDDIIFEEFKGTGNMELHLDRDLVNKRIFPAINFERSGTRKEELLYHPEELQKIYGLRRIMLGVPAFEAMEMLIQRLKKTRSNAEFLLSLSAR